MIQAKLTSEEVLKLKEITSLNLKKIVLEFNNYLRNSSEVQMDNSTINLHFSEGTSLEFRSLNRVHFEIIKDFMYYFSQNTDFSEFFKILRSHNLFNIDQDFLNPQFSVFGAFLIKYLQKLTEIELKDIKETLPLEFDRSLFDNIWEAFVPWMSNKPITIKIFYLIYGVNIEGDDFNYSKNRSLEFKIPTNEDKVLLVRDMNIEYFYFEGQFKAINRVQAIAQCTSWIEGKIEFTHEQLEQTFIDLDILHPSCIEEAFHILGISEVFVGLLTVNNKFYPQKITIQPQLDTSKCSVLASPIFQYPEWMQSLSMFPPKITLELEQPNKDFLSFYPDFRINLGKDSIVKLSIYRLIRALKSRLIMDIILEIVIGIESLLVEGTGDLSLQFRINTSWLIGRNFEERKLIEKFCKNLYTLRSKIVHEGGKTKDIEKITAKFGGQHQTAELARKLYRLILLKAAIINSRRINFIGRTELLKQLRKARLGGELGIEENQIYKRTYKNFIEKLKEWS